MVTKIKPRADESPSLIKLIARAIEAKDFVRLVDLTEEIDKLLSTSKTPYREGMVQSLMVIAGHLCTQSDFAHAGLTAYARAAYRAEKNMGGLQDEAVKAYMRHAPLAQTISDRLHVFSCAAVFAETDAVRTKAVEGMLKCIPLLETVEDRIKNYAQALSKPIIDSSLEKQIQESFIREVVLLPYIDDRLAKLADAIQDTRKGEVFRRRVVSLIIDQIATIEDTEHFLRSMDNVLWRIKNHMVPDLTEKMLPLFNKRIDSVADPLQRVKLLYNLRQTSKTTVFEREVVDAVMKAIDEMGAQSRMNTLTAILENTKSYDHSLLNNRCVDKIVSCAHEVSDPETRFKNLQLAFYHLDASYKTDNHPIYKILDESIRAIKNVEKRIQACMDIGNYYPESVGPSAMLMALEIATKIKDPKKKLNALEIISRTQHRICGAEAHEKLAQAYIKAAQQIGDNDVQQYVKALHAAKECAPYQSGVSNWVEKALEKYLPSKRDRTFVAFVDKYKIA